MKENIKYRGLKYTLNTAHDMLLSNTLEEVRKISCLFLTIIFSDSIGSCHLVHEKNYSNFLLSPNEIRDVLITLLLHGDFSFFIVKLNVMLSLFQGIIGGFSRIAAPRLLKNTSSSLLIHNVRELIYCIGMLLYFLNDDDPSHQDIYGASITARTLFIVNTICLLINESIARRKKKLVDENRAQEECCTRYGFRLFRMLSYCNSADRVVNAIIAGATTKAIDCTYYKAFLGK